MILTPDLNSMSILNLKICKQGVVVHKVTFFKHSDKSHCVYSTQEEYLRRTNDNRKSSVLIVSYKTFLPVTTCTLVRWLKQVLKFSGKKKNYSPFL